jgi:hypothetical protein
MKALSLLLTIVMLLVGVPSYADYYTVESLHAFIISHPTEANAYIEGVLDDAFAQEALRYHDEGKAENSGPLYNCMNAHPEFNVVVIKLRFESFYQENPNKVLRNAQAALAIRAVLREYCGIK